jgi:hypothetical protein
MALHESSVNFRNLICDLAEMYPFEITEVVVVELIANSLDAKATRIHIDYDSVKKVLVVEDNGLGMTSSQFEEYHDFAAGLKVKGTGIGFAGLGAKVSFNVADKVLTETHSRTLTAGSDWHMISNKKLVWENIKPKHIGKQGTRVEVQFKPNTRTVYETRMDLVNLIRRHYLPLFDTNFLDLYESMHIYPKTLRFVVNGAEVKPGLINRELSLEKAKEFFPARRNKKYGYGLLGISKMEYPVAADACGVLLCTYGKVVKIDMFNQFPGNIGARIFGLVEAPELIKFLTTSKTDFLRKGKHKEFESIYNPIRIEFKDWLAAIGVESTEIAGTDEAAALERELKKLVEKVPELSEFFGFWTKKKVMKKSEKGTESITIQQGGEVTYALREGAKGNGNGLLDVGDGPGQSALPDKKGPERAEPISRKAKKGPKIAFIDAPDRIDMAWVDGTNIIINSSHSAYLKCLSNTRSRKIQCLFAIATAIQRFLGAESDSPDLLFIDRMMMAWGEK